MTGAFETSWVRRVRFGTLAAVALPAGVDPVPPGLLERLHPRERALAESERGRRQIELAGGRLAFRAAAAAEGLDVGDLPLLSDSSRAPLPPAGWTVSLSHKEDLALALVGRADQGSLGVDLEGGSRERSGIAPRICRPEELARIESLPEPERWPDVLLRFAVKEAVYKAIAPRLGRFFGFQAARVERGPDDAVSVTMFLEPQDPRFEVEAEVLRLTDGRVVAMVRARASP